MERNIKQCHQTNSNYMDGGILSHTGRMFLGYDNNQNYGKTVEGIDGCMMSQIMCYT